MPRGIARPRALADHLRGVSELAPEDQTQDEPNSKRRENCLCRIFAHVLLCIFLERPDAIPRITPCLFCLATCLVPSLLCLAAVLSRQSACGRFQIFRCSARVVPAALQFILGGRGRGRLLFC